MWDLIVSVPDHCLSFYLTGNMPVVDWNRYKRQWSHLRIIGFPRSRSRPIVVVLMGLDCADVHYALDEVRASPGPRLIPVG